MGATALGACGYVGYKLWERQQEIMLIYREVSKALRTSNNRLKAHYDETQASCDMAVLAHLATLRARLQTLVDVDGLHALVKAETDRAHKLERFEELKLASISRTLTAVYALTLAHLLMRVVTNLIARHLMLEHAPPAPERGGDCDEPSDERALADVGLPVATQRRLLSSMDYLVKGQGLNRLLAVVEPAVRRVCAPVPLTELFGADELRALIARARELLEIGSSAHLRILDCMLPPSPAAHGSSQLPPKSGAAPSGAARAPGEDVDAWIDEQLDAELREVVRSAPFAVLFAQTLDACFGELLADLADRVRQADEPAPKKLPLAKVIPQINNCLATLLDTSAHGKPPLRSAALGARQNRYLSALGEAPSLPSSASWCMRPATRAGSRGRSI